ncbi:MAG: hypothetical protein JWN98_78 [Abditibacteriota bacterium]|nr:hypothetical protein [Abditibacteriota bacterium]
MRRVRTEMPRIQLVTRGDDAGSSFSANRAIAEAAATGTLRNISLMVPGPCFEDAVEVLCELPDIDFGLHVTLNSEWDAPRWGPLASRDAVRSLLDEDGCFTRAPKVLSERKADVDEMLTEVEAQLQRMRQAGFAICYLDEHMRVGLLPGLGTRLRELCHREGLRYANTLFHLPPVPEALPDPLDNLEAQLQAAAPGTYTLVTHPTFDDEEVQSIMRAGVPPGQVARERDADRRLFSSPRLPEILQRTNTAVVRYSDVLSPQSL